MPSSLFNTTRLENKTVLITGASGGIGAATAVLFSRAGANLILFARRIEELEKVKTLCETANKEGGTGAGGKVTVVVADMSSRTSIDAALEKVQGELNAVEVLVSNAGLAKGRDEVGEIDNSDLDDMFNTNVIGLIHLTQRLVKVFKAKNSGHVISIGSTAGTDAYAGGAIYCASKFAVRAFDTTLRKELVNTAIRVSEVQPGMVETDFSLTRFRGDKSGADAVYKNLKPMVAQDVAEEIAWIALRPTHVQIAELQVMPSCQAGGGVVHRG